MNFRALITAAALCLISGAAFASTCPSGGSIESYIYGCPAATPPYLSSLLIPAVPGPATPPSSTMENIPASAFVFGSQWPAVHDIVLSAGPGNPPSGLAEADGLCVVGAGGVWTAASCAGSGGITQLTGAVVAGPGTGSVVASVPGITGVAHEWISAISTANAGTLSQPSYLDLLGAPALHSLFLSAGAGANPTGLAEVDGDCVVGSSGAWTAGSCGGGSSAFSSLTSGTNSTAAMVVGTGASLAPSGSGAITATAAPWAGITGTPTTLAGYGITNGATNGANSNITSLTGLTTPLSVGQGGMGVTTATNHAIPLGAGTSPFTFLPEVDGDCVTGSGGVWAAVACPSGTTGSNPTATIGTTAVNGSATTYMRSDGAPAAPAATNSVLGLMKGDGTTITCTTGTCSAVVGATLTAEVSWGPGMNLSTVAIPFKNFTTNRTITAITCTPEVAVGGTATFDVYIAASGTALAAGTKVETTSCNANGTAVTDQTLGVASSAVTAGQRIGLVATGAGWGSSVGSGVLTVSYH